MIIQLETDKSQDEVLGKMARGEGLSVEELVQNLVKRWCFSFRFNEDTIDVRLKKADKKLLVDISKKFQTDHNLWAQRIIELWLDEQRTGNRKVVFKPSLTDKIKSRLRRKKDE